MKAELQRMLAEAGKGGARAVGVSLGYPAVSASQAIGKALKDRVGRDMADRIKAARGGKAPAVAVVAEPLSTPYGTDSLERVLKSAEVWWRPGMSPEQMSRVIRNARSARAKSSEDLPDRYWVDFLGQLCDQELRGERVSPTVDRSDELGGAGDVAKIPPRRKR